MGRPDGSHWLYSFVPHGIAAGATSVLIPLFAYALGGGLAEIGIIAAATSIASVPAFVLWGSLSDQLRRRKAFLLVGFFGSATGFAGMALSGTMGDFYLTNLLFGFFGAASAPVGTVLIMETSERRDWPRRLAILSRIAAFGWMVGLALGIAWLWVAPPSIGSEIASMRILFGIGAVLAFIAGVLAATWTKEPEEYVDRREVRLVDIHPRVERGRFFPMRIIYYFDPRNRRARVPLPRSLRIYLLSVLLLFAGFTSFYGFFPIFLKQIYALSSPEIFAVYVASQAASVAIYPRAALWVGVRGARVMQLYASAARGALFLAFFLVGLAALPGLLPVALVLHAGVGLCWAVINVAGSTVVSRLAPDNARAQALGAYNAVQGFGSIFGPLLGGFSAGFLGYGAAFGATVGLVIAGCGVLAYHRIAEG